MCGERKVSFVSMFSHRDVNTDAQAAIGPVSFPTGQQCVYRLHVMVQIQPIDGVTRQTQVKKKHEQDTVTAVKCYAWLPMDQ